MKNHPKNYSQLKIQLCSRFFWVRDLLRRVVEDGRPVRPLHVLPLLEDFEYTGLPGVSVPDLFLQILTTDFRFLLVYPMITSFLLSDSAMM